jgi:hypothetical protein
MSPRAQSFVSRREALGRAIGKDKPHLVTAFYQSEADRGMFLKKRFFAAHKIRETQAFEKSACHHLVSLLRQFLYRLICRTSTMAFIATHT